MPLVIAAAQSASKKGDITANVRSHERFVRVAAARGAQLIVFPELSLTGYEPGIAKDHILAPEDARLDSLRTIAVESRIAVVVGAPLRSPQGGCQLGAIVLLPDGKTSTYAKQHLHGDEKKFFEPGSGGTMLDVAGERVALAICADTSRPDHPAQAADRGASIYAAEVLLSENGFAAETRMFQDYASRHGLVVVMANHSAPTGGWVPAGKSAIWSASGEMLAAAWGREEALVVASRDEDKWSASVLTI